MNKKQSKTMKNEAINNKKTEDQPKKCPFCKHRVYDTRAHVELEHPDEAMVVYRDGEKFHVRQTGEDKQFRCPRSWCDFEVPEKNEFLVHASRCQAKPTGPRQPHPSPPREIHLSPPPASPFEAGGGIEHTPTGNQRFVAMVDRKADEEMEVDEGMKVDEEMDVDEEMKVDEEMEVDEPSSGLEYAEDISRDRGGHSQPVRVSDDDGEGKRVGVRVPFDSDTVQDEEMRKYGLVAYPPLGIIMCISCQSVINPMEIYNHIRADQRGSRVGKTYCAQLSQRFSLKPKAFLKPPSALRSAVPCLDLREDYSCCTNCNRATEHSSSLTSSPAHKCANFQVRKGFAQAFFPNAHQGGFFGVTLPPKPRDAQPVDIVQTLEDSFPDLDPADLPIALPENPRDGNHFLSIQGWVLALNGLSGAQVWSIVRTINQDVRNKVSKSIDKYLGDIHAALKETDQSMRVSIGSYTGQGWTTDVFKDIGKQAKDKYKGYVADLLTFVIGACKDILGDVQLETTKKEKEAAEKYLRSTRNHDGFEMSHFQDLVLAIFTEDRKDRPVFDVLAYRFLMMYSFRRDGSIQPCNDITQIISGMVFFARGSILIKIQSKMAADHLGFHDVRQHYEKYLYINTDFPLSSLYNDRNLLKKLIEDQERDPDVAIVGRTAILHDTVVRLDDIGTMYKSLLKRLSKMERGITFGLCDDDPRFNIDLPKYASDEPNNNTIDFFFEKVDGNGLGGLRMLMLSVLVNDKHFRDRYIFLAGNGDIAINPVACHNLLIRFSLFRALLFAVVHISSGSPARGTELASQHLRNAPGGDVRNVKIIDGRLCFVGGYNKSTSQTQRHKVIYRFPPKDLVPFLLREWLIYRPAQVKLAAMLGMEDATHRLKYLAFPGLYKPMESQDLSDMLRTAMRDHIGYEIGLRDWRQIQATFVEAFYDEVFDTFVQPAHYDQRGQSFRTGLEYYGVTVEKAFGVPHQKIVAHLNSSEFWQDLTNICKLSIPDPGPNASLETLIAHLADVVKTLFSGVEEARTIQKSIPPVIQRAVVAVMTKYAHLAPSTSDPQSPGSERPAICPHPSGLSKLRSFMKNQDARFTCPEQAQALEAVLYGSEHTFLIGPTGMGKTSVFLIPAIESPNKVTLVLVPLSSLRFDFSRRCANLGILCSEWTESHDKPTTTIVMVSPENAAQQSFLNWAIGLKRSGKLIRLVYDEAHMLHSQKFRPCFGSHGRLVEIGVPMLLMTATCPPELEGLILNKVGIKQGCRVIRAPTPRREISFNVHTFSGSGKAMKGLKADVEAALKFYGPGEKAIVFCRSHKKTDAVAKVLNCPSYHRDGRSSQELRDTLGSFLSDDDQKIIVATSLLGAGVDITHARDIWHFGAPWSIIEFAQETGRAGRDGRPASSHVFTWASNLKAQGEMNYTEDAMLRSLKAKTGCRRTLMGQVLDGVPTSCTLLGANPCDNCRQCLKKPHPESGAGLFEDPEPVLPPHAPRPPPQVPRVNLSRFSPPSAVRDAEDHLSPPPSTARALVVYKADGSSRPPQQREHGPRPSEISERTVGRLRGNAVSRPPLVLAEEEGAYDSLVENGHEVETLQESDDADIPGMLWSRARFNIATMFVEAARAKMQEMAHGPGQDDHDCSVCYALSGQKVMDHHSGGADCPNEMCYKGDPRWEKFKILLRFPPHRLCYGCLLPTVQESDNPGAEDHRKSSCMLSHLIAPAIYAFWVKAPTELRASVSQDINIEWPTLEQFSSWCTSVDEVNNLPNHILLFCCIMVHWRSLDV